ncbi:LysR substrate-binding domain-containing protein [Azospirillum halopraeferens]|uniref:LysR substrate-binding domain-containing protein n=1 Tax=Azospirillum halopraeferens TaxID=34010 RepID=UPI00040E54BC|nr:LysR substrate-binding domain-containing protein [Azospirillum halopraeferens]
MNLRDLRYLLAIAEHRHFGKAAEACHVSQPTLSGQVRKLEDWLGVTLFERTNKWVVPTEIGERILDHAARAVAAADALEAEARAARDPLVGALKLGVIPTLGPYLMPLIFRPLRRACPALTIELWEDVTDSLLERLRTRKLDAALIATDAPDGDMAERSLFTEPFLAALPEGHPLSGRDRIAESDLAADLMVLADGHCLRDQALAACSGAANDTAALRAASLETLVNMVAAGYGTTLIPGLAAGAMRGRGVVLRPLAGTASRTVRLVSRATFPRSRALDAIAAVIRQEVEPFG